VGDAVQRVGLRLGHDLLETPPRLATGWHLGLNTLCATGLALSLLQNRLVQSSRGQLFNPSRFWGPQTGPNPTDRAKLGSKRHLICDGRGVPLVIRVTGANRNDSQEALALVDAVPPCREGAGVRAVVLIACWVTVVMMRK
jgi:hypothetical protein